MRSKTKSRCRRCLYPCLPSPATSFAYTTATAPLRCRSGEKIRIAGIQAPDFTSPEPCHRPATRRTAYTCDDRAAARSQQIVERLTLNRRLTCLPVGTSYKRIVARCTLPDGRSLSCATIAAGAAVRWNRDWRKYEMGECR